MKTEKTEHAKPAAPADNPVNTVFSMAQETALITLRTAVKTEQVAEDYVQGLYKVGYDANIAVLHVAKAYWDSMTQIRQDWIKQGTDLVEKAIANPMKFEMPTLPLIPFQKEITQLGKDMATRTQKAYEAFTAPVPAAK